MKRGPKAYIEQTDHRAKIESSIRADMRMKEASWACGISHARFCQMAARLGYRRMYVTAAERAVVMAHRRAEDAQRNEEAA